MHKRQKSLYAIFLILLMVPFQNCGPSFEVIKQSDMNSVMSETDVLVKKGQALYEKNCMGCHSPMIQSTKTNRSATKITEAINNISQMTHLKSLSASDIQAIAVALERRSDGNPFTCLADRSPSNDALRRLSRDEYLNTLSDLFEGAVSLSELQAQVNLFPLDVGDDGMPFDRASRTVTSGIFSAQVSIAEKVGDLLATNATKRQRIYSESCFTASTVTDACVNTFVQRFGKKALRRPVTGGEQSLFLNAYRIGENHAEGSRYLTRVLLLHPSFLYHTEFNGTLAEGKSDLYNLSAYELASRLSFLITGSIPDAALTAKADDQSILKAEVLSQEATRLLASNKAKSSFRRFYRKYLVLDNLKAPTYSAAFRESISTSNLNEDAVEEMLSFTDYITLNNRPLPEMLNSRVAFVKSANLASVYGIAPSSSADGQVTLPAGRAGIMTRVGFLLSGNDTTNPIHRGFVTRSSLLCDEIGSPDPTKLPPGSLEHPPLDPNLSTRQRWTVKTSAPACIGCHSQINPLGFALEGFDGMGRARAQETVFNSSGTVIARIPVDTKVSPNIASESERGVDGGSELSAAVAESQKFNACFVKKWHQFAMRKKVDPQDGCMASQLYEVLQRPDGTPLEMIKSLINHPNFRQRRQSL
ncbi:hypothetical protein AZI86_00280 [Bdellovibrio bacteriovorus]|uniref:Cytochrome c domain-containing protein n=1 Tax=Bdellovibrio bacteriovorus TaxID=959 RepID=A0A150WM69_BDEBC|nr:DUF1592 domain-containing protein [Bdellovibrio bacteriovorus]KYG65552.1 hypothetical protein AZI86_00280 [Bdellovibrio bacteriovorus]